MSDVLYLLICILGCIAIVTIHNYIIMSAVLRIEEKIENIKKICMNNRDIIMQTGDYVCKNDAKLLILLDEALHDYDDMEENDDGK